MSQRPTIMFVDDEPHNLAVFEAAMPETWEVRTFDNPLSAVEQVESLRPSVIVSDQRMPGMKGVKFLEIASKLSPLSVRILCTGFSDEDLIIESVRAAKIFDYIRKPWDVDELVRRIDAAIQHHNITAQKEKYEAELKHREMELRERNAELSKKTLDLERSLQQLQEATRELQCWVPPVVTWLSESKINFPIYRDLALVVIDIVGSSAIHGKSVNLKTLHSMALDEFHMLVLKHGGYMESTEGDSAYANFGLTESTTRPCDAAMAVANEFRAALRGIADHHQETIECGIALHYGLEIEANISECSISTSIGKIVQKRFYTRSSQIDLVHRMEKHVHRLAGSNIVLSQQFVDNLKTAPKRPLSKIGAHLFKGQTNPVELLLLRSSLVNDEDLLEVMAKAG